MMPKYFWWLIGAGLALRMLVWALAYDEPSRYMSSDSVEFQNIAINILDRGSYSKSSDDPSIPDLQRTPLFPLIIAGLYLLKSRDPLIVLLFNHFVFVLTCFVLLWICRRFFSWHLGPLVLGIWTFDISAILAGNTMMAEIVFAWLFLLTLGFLLAYLKGLGFWWLAGCAALLGLLTLTKPAGAYFPLFIAGIILLPSVWSRLGKIKLALHVGCFLLIYLVILSPWLIRNYVSAGIVTISSMQEHQLLYYHAALVESEKRHMTLREAQIAIASSISDSMSGTLNERVTEDALRRRRDEALLILKQYWPTYVALTAKGMLMTMLDPNRHFISKMLTRQSGDGMWQIMAKEGSGGLLKVMWSQPLSVLLATMYSFVWAVALTLLAGIGLGLGLRSKKNRIVVAIVGLWVVMCLGTVGPAPGARFRVMFLPELSILAGVGIHLVVSWFSNHKQVMPDA